MAVRGFPFYLRERDTFCTEFVLIGKKPKKGTLLSLSERVIHLKAESLSNHSNRCSKQKTANQLQNAFFYFRGYATDHYQLERLEIPLEKSKGVQFFSWFIHSLCVFRREMKQTIPQFCIISEICSREALLSSKLSLLI